MALVDRVKAMLMSPRTEWPVIEAESNNVAAIYRNYLFYLAAVPAIAGFLGGWLFGFSLGGITYKYSFFSGVIGAIVSFVVSLVMFYLLSLVVDGLAPMFGGQRNHGNAFKLVAYGSTAALVAGVFNLIPSLSVIGILGALYTVYLFYLGLPVLMKCPPEKSLMYTVAVVVCGIVLGMIVGWLTDKVSGPSVTGMGAGGSVSMNTPAGEVKIDQGKMAEATKKIEEAAKRAEAASKAGDPAAAGKAVSEALSALGGATGGREPMSAQDLKAMLPEAVSGMKRDAYEAQSTTAMGLKGSHAKATYREGDKSIELEIRDMGGLAGLMAVAGWMNVTGDKENDREIERIYKSGNRTVREKVDKGSKDGEYTLVLPNGIIVQAEGQGVEIGALKKVVEGLDLSKLEAKKG